MRWQKSADSGSRKLNPVCGLLLYLGISMNTLSDQALLETVTNVVNWRIKIDPNESEMGRSAFGRILMPVHCDRIGPKYFTHGVHAG